MLAKVVVEADDKWLNIQKNDRAKNQGLKHIGCMTETSVRTLCAIIHLLLLVDIIAYERSMLLEMIATHTYRTRTLVYKNKSKF